MARKRGRPQKIPLLTTWSSVSARIIAETLERGDAQGLLSLRFPSRPFPMNLGSTLCSSSGLSKRLNLSTDMQLKRKHEAGRTSPDQQAVPQSNEQYWGLMKIWCRLLNNK
ncbi:hypothetical protein HAX54_043494 [Datura stramonium]|uniref:Uncharacterized protein n=1 Tax=Datura stramonium TaxID=4076 RepID=A0ABS8SNQ3_DATST|nr:hypothetical protein [Datura stramonium]